MEKDIFDIIQEKDYAQLSKVEMAELADFCANEDEFLQMKSVLVNVQAMNVANAAAPQPQVKQKLDDLFVAQPYAQAASSKGLMTVLYPRDKKLYQRPLFQIAAMVILILGIVPFLMNNEVPLNDKQLAKNEVEIKENKKPSPNDETITEKTNDNLQQKEGENAQGTLSEISAMDDESAVDSRTEQAPIFQGPGSVTTTSSTFGNSSKASPPVDIPQVSAARSQGYTSASVIEHSDGVFDKTLGGSNKFSKPLSDQPEVLDLLTASF